MTKEELIKLEAVLVACEFAQDRQDGCPTCGYDTTEICPLCSAEKASGKKGNRHNDCALWESLQAVRKQLTGAHCSECNSFS